MPLSRELAYGDDFELPLDAADILIQLRAMMFSGRGALAESGTCECPQGCDSVAWLDCDVVFEYGNWAARGSRALEWYPMLQPFRQVYGPAADASEEVVRLPRDGRRGNSLPHMLSLLDGRRPDTDPAGNAKVDTARKAHRGSPVRERSAASCRFRFQVSAARVYAQQSRLQLVQPRVHAGKLVTVLFLRTVVAPATDLSSERRIVGDHGAGSPNARRFLVG